MSFFALAAIFISTCILCILGTGALLPWLKKRALVDSPNERSSHTSPTLHGGGIAVTAVMALLFLVLAFDPFEWRLDELGEAGVWLVAGMIVLATVSWLDDLKEISQLVRLVAHFLVVVGLLQTVFSEQLVFQGLFPLWLDHALAALLWVWFINLFNFMDGIDGISGVQTACIGVGVVLLAGSNGWVDLGQSYALVIAGVGVGFLWYNWHPARVFLGDVGSVPLGFILGWLLLNLAANGFWVQALILPLYYLSDATLTLLERLGRKEKIWEAHRSHYYQQAIQKGYSHAHVAKSVLVGNAVLIGLAITSLRAPVTGLVGAAAVVFIMLLYFKHNPNN